MMKRNGFQFGLITLAVCAVALLGLMSIVGTGGGGGDTAAVAQADLSEDTVRDAVAGIEEYVPVCKGATVDSLLKTITGDESGVLNVVVQKATKSLKTTVTRADIPEFSEDTIAGTCDTDPGQLVVTREHASGITTYTFIFDNFCMASDSDPDNPTVIDGDLTYTTVGTPSDDGPVISKLRVSATSLTVTNANEETAISIDQLEYTFGTPGVEPPVPTEGAPDTITLGTLVVDYVSMGKTHKLENLNATVYESGDDAVAAITSGRYVTTSSGYVDIATTEPLVINIDNGLVGGVVTLTGANGVVTLTPQVTEEGANGIIDIALNGEALDIVVDCSGLSGLDDLLLSFF